MSELRGGNTSNNIKSQSLKKKKTGPGGGNSSNNIKSKRLNRKEQPSRAWLEGKIIGKTAEGDLILKPKFPLEGDYEKVTVFLPARLFSQNLLKPEVGDTTEFWLDMKATKSPRAWKARILKYSSQVRDREELRQYLQQHMFQQQGAEMVKQFETTFTLDVLTCKPLWEFLVRSSDADDDILDAFCQFLNLVLESSARLRENCRHLIAFLMEFPFFNNGREGGFALYIKSLCFQIEKKDYEDYIHDQLASCSRLLTSLLSIETSLAHAIRHHVRNISKLDLPWIRTWLFRMYELAAGNNRYSNEEVEWQELPLIPLSEELLGPLMDNCGLPIVRMNSPYLSTLEYMDTYFRLYRTDCFSAMKNGLSDLLNGRLDERNMGVYYNVSLTGYTLSSSNLFLTIMFETTRVIKWSSSHSFMFGNLLCLSLSGKFDDPIWATVAEKDLDLLEQKDRQSILIKLLPQYNSLPPAEIITQLSHKKTGIMVESPQYYFSFSNVMRALQEFDMESFRLKDEIVFCKSVETLPSYLSLESTIMDLGNTKCVVEVRNTESMLAETSLDPSQRKALQHALTNRLAIIQGPPGCGKTFIGTKLLQIILSASPAVPLPVLVLTYKNHALDEFLGGIQTFVEKTDIVRIGGRSRDPELDECNLTRIMAKKIDDSYQTKINSINQEIDSLKEKIDEIMENFEKSLRVTTLDCLSILSPEQLAVFFLNQFGKATPTSIAKFLKENPVLKSELTQLILGNIPSDHPVQKWKLKLDSLLATWTPKKADFQYLKQLQGEHLREIRRSQENMNQNADEEEVEEEFDPEILEAITESRLSSMGILKGKNEGKKSIKYFSQVDVAPSICHLSDFPSNIATNSNILSCEDLWKLSTAQRMVFLYTVIQPNLEASQEDLNIKLIDLERLAKAVEEVRTQQKAKLIKEAKVVGMTITGASIHKNILQDVKPAIVIVEEAAEVLECDLIAALTQNIQHLILIGDHKQLRPKVDTYTLKKDHNFDVSLMERLVSNGFPYKDLHIQNRMRPEFSYLLRPIYPYLQDNLSRVECNKPLDCVGKSMFFWDHRNNEDDGKKGRPRSKTNLEEANRAIYLAEYLLNAKCRPDQITILAAYQGQSDLIRKRLMKIKSVKEDWNLSKDENKIQVSTIDMFQGDENDYVIVSLVRSNGNQDIGFLKDESRMCVAQSRAKCGMYFLGDTSTLKTKGSPWGRLVGGMGEKQCVSEYFPINCPKHKLESKQDVKNSVELEKFVENPLSLCKYKCGTVMECGIHECSKPCLSSHSHISCMEFVSFTVPKCGHIGQKRCFEKIDGFKCTKKVTFNCPKCLLDSDVECYKKQSGKTLICKNKFVEKGLCGHLVTRKCHQKLDEAECDVPCLKTRQCGHGCTFNCGKNCHSDVCSECKSHVITELKELKKNRKYKTERLTIVSLKESGDSCNEYKTMKDRVLKYIVPMHNWYPTVTKIEKVTNMELQERYLKAKLEVRGGHFEDLKFHGTDDAGVKGICEKGFRLGSKGMFGAGIYFATDSSKSQQEIYTKGSNKLLLCKVLLGRSKTVCKSDNALNLESLREEGYDSVYAQRGTKNMGGVANDEYIIYDPKQAYPEYIIHYEKNGRFSTSSGIFANTLWDKPRSFQKTDAFSYRKMDLTDPLQNCIRFAEFHFYKMQSLYNGERREITKVTVVENENIWSRFSQKQKEFVVQGKGEVVLAYHGTRPENIDSILTNNFQEDCWRRQAHGPGNYFSEFPEVSLGYGPGLLLCQLLTGREYKGPYDLPPDYDSKLVEPNEKGSANMVIIKNSSQILPLCQIHLRN